MPYTGAKGLFIMIGEETEWGTAVARTVTFHGVTENMRRTREKRKRPVTGDHSASARTTRRFYTASDFAGGTFEVLATYEGAGILLKHALWGVSSSGAEAPYTHTYKPAATAPTGGLTIEVIRGNGTAEVFEGCRITKLTVKLEAGGLMRMTVEVIAETSGGRVAAGTPVHTTSRDLEVIHHQGSDATWNSGTFPYKSFELVIDNKLARRQLVGSPHTKDPKPSDDQEITVRLDTEWENDTLQTGYTADTESDLVLAFTGTGDNELTITVHNAYIDDNSSPVTGVGVIAETSNFRGQDDGTDLGIEIEIVNTQSSAVAA